ncbi:hypothetical protein [Thermoanaerobacterium sp. DL9XJH110]|uniref:hypothetical protein n=1 Tax=Thermoanaerobacterium sp. DL9XJH110 TaxID=3386643 RepID=UPI003BB69CE4
MKLERRLYFTKDSIFTDQTERKTIEQKVAEIIKRNENYISQLEEGDMGKIVDTNERIFFRFYVTAKTIAVDLVEDEVFIGQ